MFIKFYEGAFRYIDIMKMPYDRFMMFYHYMIYIMNMETEEGRKQNEMEDKKLNMKYGKVTIQDDIQNIKKILIGK